MSWKILVWSGSVTVKWVNCYFPRSFRGTEVKNLVKLNQAMVSKLGWKVLTDFSFVYVFLRSWFIGKFDKRYYIRSSVWPIIKEVQLVVSCSCQWIISQESQLLFWYDNWLGEPLVLKVDIRTTVCDPGFNIGD